MGSTTIKSLFACASLIYLAVSGAEVYAEQVAVNKEFKTDNARIQAMVADFQSEAALAASHDCLKKYGEMPVFHKYRAQAFKNMGNPKSAVAELTIALSEWEKRNSSAKVMGPLYRDRGEQYIRLKDYDKAIDDFSKSIELCPGLGLTSLERAECYGFKKDYKAKVADITHALKVGIDLPMKFRAYSGRADAYEKLGQMQLAKADRETVRQLHELYFN
jgi:tetratricopeptide (TPR) repeat protein